MSEPPPSYAGQCGTCARSTSRMLRDARTGQPFAAFVCEIDGPGGEFRRVHRFWSCAQYLREPGAEGDDGL